MQTYTSVYAARAAAALDKGFKTKSAQKDARADVQRAYDFIYGKTMNAIREAAPHQNAVRDLSHDEYAERAHHFEAYDLPFELRHVRDKHFPTFETFGADVAELKKLIVLLDAISKAEVAPKPAKAPRKPSIEGGELTCQCCGRLIKANKGHIAHHGYTRPGDGWQTPSCWGAGAAPFEASRDRLGRYVLELEDTVAKYEAFPTKVRNNEIKPHISVNANSHYGRRVKRTIWIDRDEFDAAKVEHNLRLYGVYTFEDLVEHCIRESNYRLKHIRSELAAQQARYDSWTGPSIAWQDGSWVAL